MAEPNAVPRWQDQKAMARGGPAPVTRPDQVMGGLSPSDIDAYVAWTESQYPNVMPWSDSTIARQYGRFYSQHEGSDKAIRMIGAALAHGKGAPERSVPEHLRGVHQRAGQMAEMLLPKLDAYRHPSLSYPADREPTSDERRAFAGYPGPGWTESEYSRTSPWAAWGSDPVAPGEQWENQQEQDAKQISDQYYSMHKPGATPQPLGQSTWADAQPPTSGRPGQRQFSPAGAAYEVISNTQNPVGAFFNNMSVLEQMIRLYRQGETESIADAASDAWKASELATKVRRTSPVYPDQYVGENASPADRIRALQRLESRKDALDPLSGGEHAILSTGEPQTVGQTVLEDVGYGAADPLTALTMGLGVAPAISAWRSGRPAAAVIGPLIRALGSEFGQEVLDNAKWTAPYAIGAAMGQGLASPDTDGRYPPGMSADEREGEMRRRERARKYAREDMMPPR